MISHIDETIENILREELPETEYEINFDIPNKEWLNKISGTKPIINVYLYDVHENLQLKSNEWEIKKSADGTYKKIPPDVRLDLYYVITVWSPATTEAVLEEHHIMSIIYAKLFEFTKIPRKYFPSELKRISPTPEIPISVASKDSFKEQGIGQFWSTLEQPWKPAVYLTVTAPISIQKHIKGKVVSTKILEYGQIGYFTLLKIQPFIRGRFSKDTTQVFKVELTDKKAELSKWRNKGAKNLIVDNIGIFSGGETVIILDGEHTEFAKIKSVINSESKLELEKPLLYNHPKVEIRVLGAEIPLSINLLEDLKEKMGTIYIKGGDVEKLNNGEIIKIKDGTREEFFIIMGILKEQAGIEEKENHFEIGGIITNNATRPSPLVGAKIEILDTSNKKIGETLTDEEGKFIFNTKENLPRKLRILKEGFKEKLIDIPAPYQLKEKDLFIKLEPA